MSSILKALKKLEEQSRSADQTPVSVPATVQVPAGKAPLRGLAWSLVLGILVGGVLVGLLLKGADPPPVASSPPAALAEGSAGPVVGSVDSPVKRLSAADRPLPARDMPPGTEHRSTMTGDSSEPPTAAAQPVSRPALAPAPSVPAKTPGLERPVVVSDVLPATPETARDLPEVRMESFDIPAPGWQRPQPLASQFAPFQVSEIIYAEERSVNMAVINDLPVMEGTVVDGALLQTILPDRVILVIDGESQQILLAPQDD